MKIRALSDLTIALLGDLFPFLGPTLTVGQKPDGSFAALQLDAAGNLIAPPQGAAHGAVTAIPTGAGQAAGTANVAARATRVGALIQNYSTSPETLWFGYSSGVNAATGVQLLAGQSCPVGNVGAIYFFSVAGTATGVVLEDYN